MEHAECHQPGQSPATHGDRRVDAQAGVVEYYREIAPFYDAELRDRDDLGFWRAVGRRHRGGRFLELGAGTGSVTEMLAPAARELMGVDISPEMLRLARARLETWPNVRLVRADMRQLPFGASSEALFDLIVAADDPFSHLTHAADRHRALREVVRHLAPGGRFVLDALWLAPDEARAVASVGGRTRSRTTVLRGEPLRVVERWRRIGKRGSLPERDRRCRARYEYARPGRAPVVAQFEAHDWSPGELFDGLERAGLRVEERWGSYDGERWEADRSQQLIVSAGRAPGER